MTAEEAVAQITAGVEKSIANIEASRQTYDIDNATEQRAIDALQALLEAISHWDVNSDIPFDFNFVIW